MSGHGGYEHGTKLEALYSVAYFGRLFESRHQSKGSVLFQGAPGISLHKDGTRHKLTITFGLRSCCPVGLFYAIKWEVRTDRTALSKVRHTTEQWV